MQHPMHAYFDDIVRSSAEIIRFDSTQKPAEGENGEYPFGKETADCLAYFLALAESFGFETHNYDNYAGEVVFGEGEPFAILAHLDVVPAGNGWKYPPFGGVINDDVSDGGVEGMKIWGRGALDDKTPAIVCLYAMKALKDANIMPRRTLKLIVGCNEESGSECIAHYKKVAQMPREGFTPDACFPVIYAEKGILHFTSQFTINDAPMYALKAGTAINIVCCEAEALLTKQAAAKLANYENPIAGTRFSYDNTTNILRVYGKSAHGSQPEFGANALQAMFAFFATFNEDCKQLYDILFADTLGLKTLRDETGPLTMSPDIASFENGVVSIQTDVRYPATLTLESVLERLDNANITYKVKRHQPPLYNDPNGKLITTLAKVYAETSGTQLAPIAIGGGTYARSLECGCAFGPEVRGEEDTVHQPNEYVSFDKIRSMSEIYYNAIKAICAPKYVRIGWLKPVK